MDASREGIMDMEKMSVVVCSNTGLELRQVPRAELFGLVHL